MKKSKLLLGKILIVGFLFMFFSCEKEEFINNGSEQNVSKLGIPEDIIADKIFLGPKIEVGNGYANSWIRVNQYSLPMEIGVEMTPEVLVNLPNDSDFIKPIIIPLPKIATELTPFNHIGINWNPDNYSDITNFNESHFGFYFYTISISERMRIPAWSQETDIKFSAYPPRNQMPYDYFPILKGIGSYAEKGRLWLSGNSQNYIPLSHTLALGTYSEAFTFINLIVTTDFLEKGKQPINNSFSQPLFYPIQKLFPREYTIYTTKNGNYCVSLVNFAHR